MVPPVPGGAPTTPLSHVGRGRWLEDRVDPIGRLPVPTRLSGDPVKPDALAPHPPPSRAVIQTGLDLHLTPTLGGGLGLDQKLGKSSNQSSCF